MARLNRDTVVAIFLLLICGIFFWATFDIEDPGYGSMNAAVWPRIILVVLLVLCLAYLAQSLRMRVAEAEPGERGLRAWLVRYRNPLWCYALFLGFLLTLPVFGMLIGGILFVFLLMTVIGRRDPRSILLHATVAVVTVGFMWSVFTFALRVMLPQGVLISAW